MEIVYFEKGLRIKIKIYKVSSLNSIKYYNRQINLIRFNLELNFYNIKYYN